MKELIVARLEIPINWALKQQKERYLVQYNKNSQIFELVADLRFADTCWFPEEWSEEEKNTNRKTITSLVNNLERFSGFCPIPAELRDELTELYTKGAPLTVQRTHQVFQKVHEQKDWTISSVENDLNGWHLDLKKERKDLKEKAQEMLNQWPLRRQEYYNSFIFSYDKIEFLREQFCEDSSD